MRDFTLKIYSRLLEALKSLDYQFQTFEEFIERPAPKTIVLRHDVDALPQNSLAMAKMEKDFDIRGTYNFRIVKQSWDEEIIKAIHQMSHEIGYHYEELATQKGNLPRAYETFRQNLEKLRTLVPVRTLCMHGSPTSKHDSRDIWKTYDYKALQLIGEPYFDVDFEKTLYLTDTGRRWDGQKVSVRDRVAETQRKKLEERGYFFVHTQDIIRAASDKEFPDRIMLTLHPQRWTDQPLPWMRELLLQNSKNVVKGVLRKIRP